MIKFEEHEGDLFRMLESPVPLTADAELPCLIRPIQDDSPMGRYVQQCWGHDKLFMREYTICGINADMAAKVGVARDTPLSIHMFEIIGYPVADGSKEWGEYQTQQGVVVRHKDGCVVRPEYDSSSRAAIFEHYPTGWQIYEEPKPESQYKVGDWVEIESSHTKGKTFVSVIKEIPNQEHYTVQVNSFFGGYTVYGIMERQIVRKLKPSEIVVRIGCLEGTVEDLSYADNGRFFLVGKATERHPVGIYSILYDEMLDATTRELVEGLLKKQNEEK